jgi:alkylhydroperoxidase family enzyme
VLRYTDLLTSRPANVDQSDVEALAAHFSDEEIVELVLVVATAAFTNRINDGVRTPLD